MDDLRALLQGGHLRSGRTIILHPEDFRELALVRDLNALEPRPDPSILLENETAFGVRIVSSPHQRQGEASVVENPPAWTIPRFPSVTSRPNANGDLFPAVQMPDLLAQVYAHHQAAAEQQISNAVARLSLDSTRVPTGLGGSAGLGSGGDGRAGLLVIEEWAEEEPKSLWQHLEEDE